MNILIPIAGEDKFFSSDEYFFPKPLIEITGTPMIELCVRNLKRQFPDAHFLFVVQSEHCSRFSLDGMLQILTDGHCSIVRMDRPTKGALCSALMAIDHIVADEPLVVTNGDQIIDGDLGRMAARSKESGCDAAVVVFESLHPRWSFVRLNDAGFVEEAAEKRVISRNAIAGFYYYRSGALFLEAALRTLEFDSDINGVYYISQTLNNLVLDGCKIATHKISSDAYHSFYSPQKVMEYERLSQRGRTSSSTVAKQRRINVVIPMAGEGSRFVRAGYIKPKPFIDVAGRTMIETVMENLALGDARYILLARKEHVVAEPDTIRRLRELGNVEIVSIDGPTEGTACTVLQAREMIDNETPLLIANCDQLVDFSCTDFVSECRTRGLDGLILCFEDVARDPKWSFAKTDDNGLVVEVAEKRAISQFATVGIYLFARGRDFVTGAVDMIARNERVNNEFYTCPVYNRIVGRGGRVGVHVVGAGAMHGLGVPEDLVKYLQLIGAQPAHARA
jgi:NDP-sugar pyrophosphorylase family protein